MPVDLSALVTENSYENLLSDTEKVTRNIGSKKALMRSVLENRFPEYLNTPIPVSFAKYSLRNGNRGEYSTSKADQTGLVAVEPILGGDRGVSNPKTGKQISSEANFTNEEFTNQLGVVLHELYHARSSLVKENDLLNDAKKVGLDANLVLKFASKGNFLSSHTNQLSEFLANAIPIRDMKKKGFSPAGLDWEDQAVMLQAMEDSIPGLKKFLDMQQNPESKPGPNVLDRILTNANK